MKALIYARQSSGKEDFSESVEAQIQNCLLLANQENMDVIGVYKDLNSSGELYPEGAEEIARLDSAYQIWLRGQSAGRGQRRGLGELIKKLPEANVLLINEMTRLYRPVNHSYLENYIHNLLQLNNITVIQVQGGMIDLSKFDQQLVLALKNRILYEDLRKKRENSLNAFRIKRDSGKLCCGSRIYAIRYHGNDKISIDPEKAEIVKKIYQKILAGIPLNRIVRECNHIAGHLMMYPSLLYSIAHQPIYAGFQYNTAGELIKNVQISGQEIIPVEDWFSVQKILSERPRKRKDTKSRWLPLSGRLICGVCKSKLVCRIDHDKVYYTCNHQKFDLSQSACSQSRIRFESGAYGGNALYDAVMPLLVIGAMEKYKNGILGREIVMGKLDQEITNLFLNGYLTKREIRCILLKIKENKYQENNNIAAETEKIFLCFIQQIAEKNISHEMYEEFLRWTDLKAFIYRQFVEFHTALGTITVRRISQSNRLWMPQWSIRFRKKILTGKNVDIPGFILCYFTGEKQILADFNKIKVISK